MAAPSDLKKARTRLRSELLSLLDIIRVERSSPLFEGLSRLRDLVASLTGIAAGSTIELGALSESADVLRLMRECRRLIQVELVPFLDPEVLTPEGIAQLRRETAVLLDAIYQIEGICERAEKPYS